MLWSRESYENLGSTVFIEFKYDVTSPSAQVQPITLVQEIVDDSRLWIAGLHVNSSRLSLPWHLCVP